VAAEVPTKEPLEFRAGDSVSWSKSIADYPADEYTLTYRARGVGTFDITCTADGTDFLAALTAAQTTALQAGDYWIVGTVADIATGTDVQTKYAANIRVLPNFATLTAGHDGRSHARKMLDSLQSAQLGAGGSRIVSYTIQGERSVQLMDAAQWQKEYGFWEARVRQEEIQAAIDRGETGAGKIYMRFTPVR
jgi:hypothetical protein